MTASKKRVIVVGAGPGGLAAAMLLAHRGYEVAVYEKEPEVGGRNSSLRQDGYTFDLGPTFFMMKDVLEDVFSLCGEELSSHVRLQEIDPLYRLQFAPGKELFPSRDPVKMRAEIERLFPGESEGLSRYLNKEQKKYDKIVPCLKVPYDSFRALFTRRFLGALPWFDAHRSLVGVLGRYFKSEQLKLAFTFQAKYIGMSPWQAPGTFSIISFIEHHGGIFHVAGGLHQLSLAMARVAEARGAVIHRATPVSQVLVESGAAVGVVLEDGTVDRADRLVINADFAHAMKQLVLPADRRKYTDRKLDRMKYSCSTFMLYLGLDTVYRDLPHHNILFSPEYRANVREISETYELSMDPSIYVHNPSVIDPSLAPAGHSALYILVPVTNNLAGINWDAERQRYRDLVLDLVEERTGIRDLRAHIRTELTVTPSDWATRYAVYNGATFNLAHNFGQMLMFRPHNKFEEFRNCFLVGGGTHPGSGLPTIYESGRIAAMQLMEQDGLALDP